MHLPLQKYNKASQLSYINKMFIQLPQVSGWEPSKSSCSLLRLCVSACNIGSILTLCSYQYLFMYLQLVKLVLPYLDLDQPDWFCINFAFVSELASPCFVSDHLILYITLLYVWPSNSLYSLSCLLWFIIYNGNSTKAFIKNPPCKNTPWKKLA